MTYNERRAIEVFYKLSDEIFELKEQINTLNEQRLVASDYLCLVNGPCQECQNSHWPHCGSD